MKNIITVILLFLCVSAKSQITPTPIASPRIALDYFYFSDTVRFGTWAYPYTGTPVVNLQILPGAIPLDNTDTYFLTFDETTKRLQYRTYASLGIGGGGGSGTVTDFTFTNDNGILGTVTNSTTTPDLYLSFDLLDKQVPFAYQNVDGTHYGIKGKSTFYYDDIDDVLHLEGANTDLYIGGEFWTGTTTPTQFLSDGRMYTYAGTSTTPGCMLIGEAGGGIMKILNAGTLGQHLRVKADLEPEWYTPVYSHPLDFTGETISILGLNSIGTSGQMIRINAGETGFEYFTPSFGTGSVTSVDLSVTNTSGVGATTSVTGSPVTGSGTITLNIPDAGISVQRGLVTNSNQTFEGDKVFNNFATFNDDAIFADLAWFGTNKTKFDANGRMYLYNNVTPAAGMLLKGDGTDFKTLALGSANQVLAVNSGGTDAAWTTLPNSVDDGSTKGVASFTAADFNATSGNISIDYSNGQAATSGQDGFLQSSDWTTFNNKVGVVDIEEYTAQTGSLGATTTYTTPASDGYYRISVTATVTTAAGTTMDLAIQLRYTEATDNVVKTFPTANVNNYNRTQTNTTGASVSITSVCHIKASTNIQFLTSFSPTGGSPQYNVHVTIEKLQ